MKTYKMGTFKILGFLLTYPKQELIDNSEEMYQVIKQENLLPAKPMKQLDEFFTYLNSQSLISLQEQYVVTFDRSRAHSLYLFEHIHGESRDRGQAMVDLKETYAEKGLEIDSNELPDYLPVFMDFLSYCSPEEAKELLAEAVNIIALVGKRLQQKESVYANLFQSIESLSAVSPEKHVLKQSLEKSLKDPETLEELDQQWEDFPAFGTDDCSSCHQPSTTSTINLVRGI